MRDREKGRVDLQLRRESQAVTDRQTNLTALSFSSFSLLLRLHSRPASPMHRIAHTCTCSHTYLCCEPRCPFPLFFAFRVSTSLSLSIPADLRVFLRLPSLSFSLPLFLVSFLAFLSLRFLQHLPTPYSSQHRDVPSLPSSSVLLSLTFPLGLFLSFLSLDQVPAYYVTLLPRATIFNPETRSNCEFSACTCTCTIVVAPSTSVLPLPLPPLPHLPVVSFFPLFHSSLSTFGKG